METDGAKTAGRIRSAAVFQAVMDRQLFKMHVKLETQGEYEIMSDQIVSGSFAITSFGMLGPVSTSSMRTWRDIRADNSQVYLLNFPLRGGMRISHNGRRCTVNADQFTITRSNVPYSWETLQDDARHESVTLTVPAHIARQALPGIDAISGMALPVDGGDAAAARDMLVTLASRGHKMSQQTLQDVSQMIPKAIARSLADGGLCEENIKLIDHNIRIILNYIDQHISDPDLSIAKVSRNCDMTSGYVQSLLWRHGYSYHDYVWENRCSRAYNRIADPRFAQEPISSIALQEGFKSCAHFSRAFKKRFGTSPSNLRAEIRVS